MLVAILSILKIDLTCTLVSILGLLTLIYIYILFYFYSEYGLNTSISLSNTLLADGSIVGRRGTKRTGTDFLSRYNLDPNRLWKRKQYRISNIGHVDHMGRYDIKKCSFIKAMLF